MWCILALISFVFYIEAWKGVHGANWVNLVYFPFIKACVRRSEAQSLSLSFTVWVKGINAPIYWSQAERLTFSVSAGVRLAPTPNCLYWLPPWHFKEAGYIIFCCAVRFNCLFCFYEFGQRKFMVNIRMRGVKWTAAVLVFPASRRLDAAETVWFDWGSSSGSVLMSGFCLLFVRLQINRQ